MSEENIDKLAKPDKDFVDGLISSMKIALIFRALYKNNLISESEINDFYDKLKVIDLEFFQNQADKGTDQDYIETTYKAYLESIELAWENTLNAAKNDLYLK